MGWRDWFKSAQPAPPEHDPRLGQLTWTAGEDGWCGSFNGFRFILAHECGSHPPEALKAYAIEVLQDRDALLAALAHSIATAPDYLKPFREEMLTLGYEDLVFSVGVRGRGIFASLGPGRDHRCWRLEFNDRNCEGIGFDS
jgi:hypothetical protein